MATFIEQLSFHCRDNNLLDSVIPKPTATADALIAVDKIKAFASELQSSTAFLANFTVLDEKIPVVKTTINELIAGPDRTLADLFDITGEY